MNVYQINIYNETTSYKSDIICNSFIKSFVEKVHYINLCEKADIISYKPWIGLINSLNCNKTYLEDYILMNMNLLITTSNIKVRNILSCIIERDDLELQSNIIYTASITKKVSYLKNVNTILVYGLILITSFKLLKILYLWIISIIKKHNQSKKIKRIKFNDKNKYKSCTICLEDFIINENVSILLCEHTYHTNCIEDWVNIKKDNVNVKCPNCNAPIYISQNEEISEPLI